MLKTLNKKFSDLAAAVAYAECGEWEWARECIGDFESAAGSGNRKFIVLFQDKIIAPPFLDYVTNLSIRLCYDMIFLHLPRRSGDGGEPRPSLDSIKEGFLDYYRQFVATAQHAGIGVHYFVSSGSPSESLEKLYHRVGHVEFAIVQQGFGADEGATLGLPLFIYRS